jgi:hypothetical protein
MKKEIEILKDSVDKIKTARAEIIGNDTLWHVLYHAEKYLQDQFKVEFDQQYREQDQTLAAEIIS